jgi:flavin reductase (DIM6/NTAB) family NADH-FMN oxidoreductase RutF
MAGLSVDPATLSVRDRKKIIQGLVVPRPIAFITSMSGRGVVNAAPFSFFNAVSVDPPVLAFGIEPRDDGGLKDSAANILDQGEFVVNLVDEALGETMNQCSTDFPSDTSEVELLGIEVLPSNIVKPPRVAAAPASFECRLRNKIELGTSHFVFLGEIVYVHIRDGIVEPSKLYADLDTYRPLARLSGSFYASIGKPYTHHRLSYEQWLAQNEKPADV